MQPCSDYLTSFAFYFTLSKARFKLLDYGAHKDTHQRGTNFS